MIKPRHPYADSARSKLSGSGKVCVALTKAVYVVVPPIRGQITGKIYKLKGPYNAIVDGAEHFRNSTLNVEELIHRFHSGADGVTSW